MILLFRVSTKAAVITRLWLQTSPRATAARHRHTRVCDNNILVNIYSWLFTDRKELNHKKKKKKITE